MTQKSLDKNWIDDVLIFWFEELTAKDWFVKNDAVDVAITSRFENVYQEISQTVPDECRSSTKAALAGIIVLDQFPRNMFRNSPKAFETDQVALSLAEEAISLGLDEGLNVTERQFLYMPYQHSENGSVQARSIELYSTLGDPNLLDFAQRHKVIIDRFGRFPHRNDTLGRDTTAEEAIFLQQAGSSF